MSPFGPNYDDWKCGPPDDLMSRSEEEAERRANQWRKDRAERLRKAKEENDGKA